MALVALAPVDVGRTNPSVPVLGGPTALGAGTQAGEEVSSYGNSSLRLGVRQLSPEDGTSLGVTPGGWSNTLSTLALAPAPLSHGVSDLAREVAYAQAHGLPGLARVPGDVPFTGSPLSLVGGVLGG